MRRAAIVAPVRTAVGGFGGTLRPLRAEDLAARVIEAVIARSGVDPELVEDVVMAQSYANSEAPCIGRWAALHAGLPISVPGLQIDRRCGGGLQAVVTASMVVQTGAADVAIAVPQRRGDPLVFDRDEGVRPDTTAETLTRLRTIVPDGTVTAGNSSQQNDAAAACLVVAEDRLEALGLEPIGYLEGWAAVGCEPSRMGIGPVGAVEKLFSRTGLGFDDMDLIEINEAFAVQVLAVLAGWGVKLDDVDDRLNVNGSGISLGHPIGATGVRILTTMLHELRRRGGGLALETMCIGGGQGIAALFRGATA
jgi:acetyl-CoA acetyltransferase